MSQISMQYLQKQSKKNNQKDLDKQNNQLFYDSCDEILYSGNAIQSRRILRKIVTKNAKNTKLDEIRESNREKEEIITNGFFPNVKQILQKIKNFNIKDSIINYFKSNQKNENPSTEQQENNSKLSNNSLQQDSNYKINTFENNQIIQNEQNKEQQIKNNNICQKILNDNQKIIQNTHDIKIYNQLNNPNYNQKKSLQNFKDQMIQKQKQQESFNQQQSKNQSLFKNQNGFKLNLKYQSNPQLNSQIYYDTVNNNVKNTQNNKNMNTLQKMIIYYDNKYTKESTQNKLNINNYNQEIERANVIKSTPINHNNTIYRNQNPIKKGHISNIQELIKSTAKMEVDRLVNQQKFQSRINWIPSENTKIPLNVETQQQKKKIQKVQNKIEQKQNLKNKYIINDDQFEQQNKSQSEEENYDSLDQQHGIITKSIKRKSTNKNQIHQSNPSKKIKMRYAPSDQMNTSCSSDENDIKNKIIRFKKSRARKSPSSSDQSLQLNNLDTRKNFQNVMNQIEETKEIIESLGQFLKKVNDPHGDHSFNEKKKEDIHKQILEVLQNNNMRQLKECDEFSSYFKYQENQVSLKECPSVQESSSFESNPFNIDSVFNNSASKEEEIIQHTKKQENVDLSEGIVYQLNTDFKFNEDMNNSNKQSDNYFMQTFNKKENNLFNQDITNNNNNNNNNVNNIFTTIICNSSDNLTTNIDQNLNKTSQPTQNEIKNNEQEQKQSPQIKQECISQSQNLNIDKSQQPLESKNEENETAKMNQFETVQNKEIFILESKIDNKNQQISNEQNNQKEIKQLVLPENNDNEKTPIKQSSNDENKLESQLNSEVNKNQKAQNGSNSSSLIQKTQEQKPNNPFTQGNNPFQTPSYTTNKQQQQPFSLDMLIKQNQNKNIFTQSPTPIQNKSESLNNNLFNKGNNLFEQSTNTQTQINNNEKNNLFSKSNTQNNWLSNSNIDTKSNENKKSSNNNENNLIQSNLFSNNKSNNIFNTQENQFNMNNNNQNLFQNNNYNSNNCFVSNNQSNNYNLNNQNNNSFLNQDTLFNSNQNNMWQNIYQTQNNMSNNNNNNSWNSNSTTINNNCNQLWNKNTQNVNNMNQMGIENQFNTNNNYNNQILTNQFNNNYNSLNMSNTNQFNSNSNSNSNYFSTFNSPISTNQQQYYESQLTNYFTSNQGASNLFSNSQSSFHNSSQKTVPDLNTNSNLNTPQLLDNSSKQKQNKKSDQARVTKLLGSYNNHNRIH